MLTRKQHLPILLSILLISLIFMHSVYAKDIKKKVIKETQLDEQIELFCNEYCQGNKKKGYLKSITLDKINPDNYRVVGRAALQSKHVYANYVVYNHTVIINTFGTLNPNSCELRVDEIFVQNDFNNIFTKLIQNQSDIIGRKESVPDCKKFLN